MYEKIKPPNDRGFVNLSQVDHILSGMTMYL